MDSLYQSYLASLQHVLQNLYDPSELRKSRLAVLLGFERQPNPALALQDAITNAIQALRPRADVPLNAIAWRLYNVMVYRFVEQISQPQVAENLGFSVRQLRRTEREAELHLADYLWKQAGLDHLPAASVSAQDSPTPQSPDQDILTPSRQQELDWLQDSFPQEPVQVQELVEWAVKAASPLSHSLGKVIQVQAAVDLPAVVGQVAAMRQVVLNLLLAAIHASQSGPVELTVGEETGALRVSFSTPAGVQSAPDQSVGELVEMAQRFAELFNGEVSVADAPGFQASVRLPVGESILVLVVDDNTDTLRLLQRYLTGTQYRFIGLQDPEKVLLVVQETPPAVIVMDVMMPGIDDWELLGRLRAHPAARHIPVIICTILPQEQLALALGAAAFLRKPVRREEFLALLARQTDRV